MGFDAGLKTKDATEASRKPRRYLPERVVEIERMKAILRREESDDDVKLKHNREIRDQKTITKKGGKMLRGGGEDGGDKEDGSWKERGGG